MTDGAPQPGQIWDMKQTAAMRRDRITRAVRIEGYAADFCGEKQVMVVPADGARGRRSIIGLRAFLRRFTLRETP